MPIYLYIFWDENSVIIIFLFRSVSFCFVYVCSEFSLELPLVRSHYMLFNRKLSDFFRFCLDELSVLISSRTSMARTPLELLKICSRQG